MLVLLRTLLFIVIAARLSASLVAQAEDYPLPYAKLLKASEAREVLHCPLCGDAFMTTDYSTYVVRTAEDLNLIFSNPVTASRAAKLLNWMAGAKNECAEKAYSLAFEEYSEMMATSAAPAVDGPLTRDIRTSVAPLLPLSEYVVPTMHSCTAHGLGSRKLSPDRHLRSGLRWTKR